MFQSNLSLRVKVAERSIIWHNYSKTRTKILEYFKKYNYSFSWEYLYLKLIFCNMFTFSILSELNKKVFKSSSNNNHNMQLKYKIVKLVKMYKEKKK